MSNARPYLPWSPWKHMLIWSYYKIETAWNDDPTLGGQRHWRVAWIHNRLCINEKYFCWVKWLRFGDDWYHLIHSLCIFFLLQLCIYSSALPHNPRAPEGQCPCFVISVSSVHRKGACYWDGAHWTFLVLMDESHHIYICQVGKWYSEKWSYCTAKFLFSSFCHPCLPHCSSD